MGTDPWRSPFNEPKDRIDGPLLQILEQALQAVRGITEAAEAHCF